MQNGSQNFSLAKAELVYHFCDEAERILIFAELGELMSVPVMQGHLSPM